MRKFTVLVEKGEQEYIGYMVELPGCHTQESTIDELMANVKEAVELYSRQQEKMLSRLKLLTHEQWKQVVRQKGKVIEPELLKAILWDLEITLEDFIAHL